MSAVLHDVAVGLQTGGIFFYKALWSILFGVCVTAIIDVFVNKEKMAGMLGGRGPKTVGIAAGLGAASSACTFGAVSISQALYKKGASTEATLAFALASTNIVFELAVLIYVLLGGAVLAGELLSGLMLIVIMYTLVHLTLPVKTFELARRRLQERDKGTPSAMRRLTDVGIWHRIADRYFRTLNRIGKSVAFGFFAAGFIAALMPARVWTVLFLAPRGFLRILENAMLGIGVGMLSMIGSIGIVPFAAALAVGGVGFPGVLGCIVADLITIPVLNVWRRFFGARATAYITVILFTSMVGSTVLITYIFRQFGWLPTALKTGPTTHFHFHLNYTLMLNVLFLGITLALWTVKKFGEAKQNAQA